MRFRSSALCHLVTKFEPYAELVEHRAADNSLKLEFQSWFELYSRDGILVEPGVSTMASSPAWRK